MSSPASLASLDSARFKTLPLQEHLLAARVALAELKGVADSLPNAGILISALSLREARASSEIESIVTTQDEVFRSEIGAVGLGENLAAKEVQRYRQALWLGYEAIRSSSLITNNLIKKIQAELECNNAGFRRLPGTALKNSLGEVVYEPPQHPEQIEALMAEFERYMNTDELMPADPLVRMAVLHHQFESIHPFYDGNGRTGRILNVLYLVRVGLLKTPILYLSSHIVRTKADYYRLLQLVRTEDAWESWVEYVLRAVEVTARQSLQTVIEIRESLAEYKQVIRAQFKFYSQDLINNLFRHPYTKIELVERDLQVSRQTATKYLDAMAEAGLLEKHRAGRTNYYINKSLTSILAREPI